MAFKRCTRIVYNTLAEDFDDLDGMFFDVVPGDFFIVWCRFTNYKLFQKKKSMKMEFTANTLGLDIKREEVEDNKNTLCKVVLTKRMNAQIDEDNP